MVSESYRTGPKKIQAYLFFYFVFCSPLLRNSPPPLDTHTAIPAPLPRLKIAIKVFFLKALSTAALLSLQFHFVGKGEVKEGYFNPIFMAHDSRDESWVIVSLPTKHVKALLLLIKCQEPGTNFATVQCIFRFSASIS